MIKKTTFYVTFLSPGSFVANESTREVKSPDPRNVAWPDSAYAFTMHRREDVIDGGAVYHGKPEQIGPTYYHPASKVESIDEVRLNPNASGVLIANMENNGWTHIIWSRWGNWPQPYEAGKAEVLK